MILILKVMMMLMMMEDEMSFGGCSPFHSLHHYPYSYSHHLSYPVLHLVCGGEGTGRGRGRVGLTENDVAWMTSHTHPTPHHHNKIQDTRYKIKDGRGSNQSESLDV